MACVMLPLIYPFLTRRDDVVPVVSPVIRSLRCLLLQVVKKLLPSFFAAFAIQVTVLNMKFAHKL